jgi:predicted DNA-binding transcriptional regulator AlpA
MTDHDDRPRLISRQEAAAYCGINKTTFSTWVTTHKMPPPIPGTRKWDKKAIDAKLDEISGLGANNIEDEYEKMKRERDARRAKRLAGK